MYLPLSVGVLCLSLFCYALRCVHSSFAIILKRIRYLVAMLLMSYRCTVTINVLWLFLAVPRVGLQCVIVVFPDHIRLRFGSIGKLGSKCLGFSMVLSHWINRGLGSFINCDICALG